MVRKRKAVGPVFTERDLDLFSSYERQREDGSIPIRDQKRHAEQMLEVLHPEQFTIYRLRKEAYEEKEISALLKIPIRTVRRRRDFCLAWLTKALINGE